MASRLLHFFQRSGEYGVVLGLLVLHLLCFSLPGRTAKLASSNLMTNLSRLENLQRLTPQTTVLAGSSITGRLLEEYFTQPVLNLGLDGCGSLESLQALLAEPQRPAVVLIELNTFKPGLDKAYTIVRDARQLRRAEVARFLPFLHVAERPVDLLYDFTRTLKQDRQQSQGGRIAWNEAIRVTTVPATVNTPRPPTADESAYLSSARVVLTALRQAHCKLAFVLVADSLFHDPWHDANFARALELSATLDIPVFDLRKATGVETLSWTDGIHLTTNAARTVAQFLESEIIPLAK